MHRGWGLTAMLAALAGPAAAAPLDGVWTGTYVCAQGVTSLELFISTQPGAAPAALFHFGNGTPARPEGCFAMQGTINAGTLAFAATHWLLRPGGYVTVNLLGSVEAGSTYAGWVDGPGCTSFTLQRQAMRPLPAACRDKDSAIS